MTDKKYPGSGLPLGPDKNRRQAFSQQNAGQNPGQGSRPGARTAARHAFGGRARPYENRVNKKPYSSGVAGARLVNRISLSASVGPMGRLGDVVALNNGLGGGPQENIMSQFPELPNGMLCLGNDAAHKHTRNQVSINSGGEQVAALYFSVRPHRKDREDRASGAPGRIDVAGLLAQGDAFLKRREELAQTNNASPDSHDNHPQKNLKDALMAALDPFDDDEPAHSPFPTSSTSAAESTIPVLLPVHILPRCANCGRSSHRVDACIWNREDGLVHGCPIHNSPSHTFDECNEFRDKSLEEKLQVLVHDRANLPQLATKAENLWCKIVMDCMDRVAGFATPAAFPWTTQAAAATHGLQETIWYQQKWEDSKDRSMLKSDPATASWQAVEQSVAEGTIAMSDSYRPKNAP